MDIGDSVFTILSPNLGCPHIVGVDELKTDSGGGITLIVASCYGDTTSPLKGVFNGILSLRPSYPDSSSRCTIPLEPQGDPKEIKDWGRLAEFDSLDDTRELINSELHYNVLGASTRYWKLCLKPDLTNGEFSDLLGEQGGVRRAPRLYDLVLHDGQGNRESVNLHAVQFVENKSGRCEFIHLTDLHVAMRNDEILGEVVKVKNDRSRAEIESGYINFNDRFRDFIRIANELAENGELDFVVITGDLVDFAFLGWEDCQNNDENNWKTFVNILTGGGKEAQKGNHGIKVAVYTSTGNHDWRVHPYDPTVGNINKTFGLQKDELANYDYKAFDSKEFRAKRLTTATDKLVNEQFEKLNVDAFVKSNEIKLTKFAYKYFTTTSYIVFSVLGLAGGGIVGGIEKNMMWLLGALAGLVPWLVKQVVRKTFEKQVNFMLYNPILAEPVSLHYYLRHINPFLDYAFTYGRHSFIVMDTGADVFTGELDKAEIKKIKRMSVEDNVFGGSPDSQGFDSDQCYCNWSQIVWLEKVLAVRSKDGGTDGRNFVFLHSPPINPPHDDDFKTFRESAMDPGAAYITRDVCNLTFGTINNYLSEFYHLCTGCRESDNPGTVGDRRLKTVDIVFSGHAHRSIEFRLERLQDGVSQELRIYSDVYSELIEKDRGMEWWDRHRPVVVQTAACGVAGVFDEDPPYYRMVSIDGHGLVSDFRVRNHNGLVNFVEGNQVPMTGMA